MTAATPAAPPMESILIVRTYGIHLPMSTLSDARLPFGSRRAATRQRLVGAASRLVIEKGFNAASLDEIASRAGVTKGAIYDNFDSKDALMAAVVTSWPSGVDAFPWPEDRTGSLRERMSLLGQAFAAHLVETQTEARIRAELTAYVVTRPAIRSLLADHNADRLQRIERRLGGLVGPAEIAISMTSFATAVDALMTGLLYMLFQVPEAVSPGRVIEAFQSLAGP
jgi:AcrR family transcriptional regulator